MEKESNALIYNTPDGDVTIRAAVRRLLQGGEGNR